MRITIESTEKLTNLVIRGESGGVARLEVPVRIWEGHTESGIPVHCFITRICPTVQDTPENAAKFEEFERELKEQRKPSSAIASIPLRMIL